MPGFDAPQALVANLVKYADPRGDRMARRLRRGFTSFRAAVLSRVGRLGFAPREREEAESALHGRNSMLPKTSL